MRKTNFFSFSENWKTFVIIHQVAWTMMEDNLRIVHKTWRDRLTLRSFAYIFLYFSGLKTVFLQGTLPTWYRTNKFCSYLELHLKIIKPLGCTFDNLLCKQYPSILGLFKLFASNIQTLHRSLLNFAFILLIIAWRCGTLVFTIPQLHFTKPKLRFRRVECVQ